MLDKEIQGIENMLDSESKSSEDGRVLMAEIKRIKAILKAKSDIENDGWYWYEDFLAWVSR